MVDVDRIRGACEKLVNEPLFHLSLHSKELFHSNLLAWFFERWPTRGRQALLALGAPERRGALTHQVRRESKNLDLIVEVPGLAPVVIENKVFSLPDETQLDRYAASPVADLEDPFFILLSLAQVSWTTHVSAGGIWHAIDYRRLAVALRDAVTHVMDDRTDPSGFASDVIVHYTSMVDCLVAVMAEVAIVDDDEPFVLGSNAQAPLRSARIYDAASKLRSRALVHHLRQAVHGDLPMAWHSDFTNGQPLVEAFVELGNGDRIGWQFQAKQWRLAVITASHVGRTPEIREARHAYVLNRYREWFDFKVADRVLGKPARIPKTESVGSFNRYDPDFAYRYRSAPDVTVTQLTVLASECADRARQWL